MRFCIFSCPFCTIFLPLYPSIFLPLEIRRLPPPPTLPCHPVSSSHPMFSTSHPFSLSSSSLPSNQDQTNFLNNILEICGHFLCRQDPAGETAGAEQVCASVFRTTICLLFLSWSFFMSYICIFRN